MKKYEVVFILNERRLDDQGAAFAEAFGQQITETGGSVVETTNLGQRQLAHMIGKHSVGTYWAFVVECPETAVAPIKESYRLNDAVLRVEFFVFDRPDVVRGKKPEEVEAEAAAAAAAKEESAAE